MTLRSRINRREPWGGQCLMEARGSMVLGAERIDSRACLDSAEYAYRGECREDNAV
jgi:hypothetical protein